MKQKLIYIVGHNHSGTTIINKILNTDQNSISIGELIHIDKTQIKNSSIKSVANSWNSILNNINLSETFSNKKYSRIKKIKNIVSLTFNKKNSVYREDQKLYNNISKEISKLSYNTIIENSKSFERLLYIKNLKKYDIKVIYVVRDGKSVICSHSKKRNKSIFKAYYRWLFSNIFIIFCLKFSKTNYLKINYDDLCNDLDKNIDYINEKLSLDISKKKLIENINSSKSLEFSGNPIINKKITQITADNIWKTKFSKIEKILVKTLTFIPNKIFLK